MILPTLACPSCCAYCFGPRGKRDVMPLDVVSALARRYNQSRWPLAVTFHGGEPLVAGIEFFRAALPLLRDELAPRSVHFGIQSNLWHLDAELCEVFREHEVSIGTSLDGPRPITDRNRGSGYYDRTMKGVSLARRAGLEVKAISTFTSVSRHSTREVFDFFVHEELGST